jgi:hypothetical protein
MHKLCFKKTQPQFNTSTDSLPYVPQLIHLCLLPLLLKEAEQKDTIVEAVFAASSSFLLVLVMTVCVAVAETRLTSPAGPNGKDFVLPWSFLFMIHLNAVY